MAADKKVTEAPAAKAAAPAKDAKKPLKAKKGKHSKLVKVNGKYVKAPVKLLKAKPVKLVKGMVTNQMRKNWSLAPSKDARAKVGKNATKVPTKTVYKAPVKVVSEARKKAMAARKVQRDAKKAQLVVKKAAYEAKIAADPSAAKPAILKKKFGERKPMTKKYVSGARKDIIRRAKQFVANKKAHNMTRRALMVKHLPCGRGRSLYVKKISKQTPRSMTNPKMSKLKPGVVRGKDSHDVLKVVRATRIAHANRQAALALSGPEKEKKFRRITKNKILPKNYLGKYTPSAVSTKKTLIMGNLPKDATEKDIRKKLAPHKYDICNVEVTMNKGGGRKATKDDKGKPIPYCTGVALIKVKNAGAMKMLKHNNYRSVIMGGRRARFYEAPKSKAVLKSERALISRRSKAYFKKMEETKAAKKVMQANFLVNKEKEAKRSKSRRQPKYAPKKLIRGSDGQVTRVVINKAARSPKITRQKLSGAKARKAMARATRN